MKRIAEGKHSVLRRHPLYQRSGLSPARLLATEVIEEAPFHEISDAAFDRAMEQVKSCKAVIDAGCEIGPCNRRMQELIDAARSMGKLQRGGWK